jgi:high-affinity iron transporter
MKKTTIFATLAISIILISQITISNYAQKNNNQENSTMILAESFSIIAREGLETIIIISTIIAYLSKTGNEKKKKYIYYGVALGIITSIITGIALNETLESNKSQKEIIEGITTILAAIIMLYTTNWFLGKIDKKIWVNHIEKQTKNAINKNSEKTLTIIAFLAVYREGFETVLFYKALAITTNQPNIIAGFILGIIFLSIAYFLINKIENKLPTKTIFSITSIILFILSFKFAGKGIHELQEAKIINETIIQIPKIKELGIYQTAETTITQTIVLIIGIILIYKHYLQNLKKKRNKNLTKKLAC